ncbi:MAG: hypothetical protein ACLP3B_05210 [Syntrophobacteraceae bacterium]
MAGIESYKRLDIRFLHKKNLLRPGYSFTFLWNRGGEPSGSIQIKVEDDYFILKYRYSRYEESEDVEEQVSVDWTRCNYGGRRPWFLCPRCRRRVAVLACAGKLFLCRHCYRLKYWSQLETYLDRANRKVQKLRERLGGKPWLKPKRMHQTTFDRLHNRLMDAEMQANRLFVIGAAKILVRSPSFRERYK